MCCFDAHWLTRGGFLAGDSQGRLHAEGHETGSPVNPQTFISVERVWQELWVAPVLKEMQDIESQAGAEKGGRRRAGALYPRIRWPCALQMAWFRCLYSKHIGKNLLDI